MRAKKRATQATGVSRARMYMRRDLGWINGFPCGGGEWLELAPQGAARKRVIDGNLTRRSTRTLNRLLREFPRELPRIVGDTTRWAQSVRELLELLKPTIHNGDALPGAPLAGHPFASASVQKRARELHGQHAALRPLLLAFEWYGWTDPKRFGASLRWIADQAEWIEVIARRLGDDAPALTIRLWQLTA